MRNVMRWMRPGWVAAIPCAACAMLLAAPVGLRGATPAGTEGGRVADTVFGARTAVDRTAAALEERFKTMEKALESIEIRLGRSVQPPTLSNNFERRMQDLEKRLAALERDIKRLDERVRRIETRRP